MTKEEKIAKLREAQALQAAHPARDTYARDEQGQRCDPRSEQAVCFCAVGALRRVFDSDSDSGIRLALFDTYPRAIDIGAGKAFENLIDASDAYDKDRLTAAWDALVGLVEAHA